MICRTPRAVWESGDLFLVTFRKRYDGFQFDRGLALVALSKTGADDELYVFPQRGAPAGARLNPTEALLLKIFGEIIDNTVNF